VNTLLTEWLSDTAEIERIEQQASIGPSAEYAARIGLWDTLKECQQPRSKNGRPKKGRPSEPRRFIRVHNVYNKDWLSKASPADLAARKVAMTSAFLAARIRQYADRQSTDLQKHLADWCTGIADAVEANDAPRAAECALRALEEMESLVDTYVMPDAHVGRKKMKGAKKGGLISRGKHDAL
jgi:hypothetical protein